MALWEEGNCGSKEEIWPSGSNPLEALTVLQALLSDWPPGGPEGLARMLARVEPTEVANLRGLGSRSLEISTGAEKGEQK